MGHLAGEERGLEYGPEEVEVGPAVAALTKGPGVLARDAALLAGAPVRVEVTVTQLAEVAKVGLVRR